MSTSPPTETLFTVFLKLCVISAFFFGNLKCGCNHDSSLVSFGTRILDQEWYHCASKTSFDFRSNLTDYCLFPRMKVLLKGHRFQSAEEVKEIAMAALKEVTGKGLQEYFQ
jgi:hypothetical protein